MAENFKGLQIEKIITSPYNLINIEPGEFVLRIGDKFFSSGFDDPAPLIEFYDGTAYEIYKIEPWSFHYDSNRVIFESELGHLGGICLDNFRKIIGSKRTIDNKAIHSEFEGTPFKENDNSGKSAWYSFIDSNESFSIGFNPIHAEYKYRVMGERESKRIVLYSDFVFPKSLQDMRSLFED